jgi:ABC-type transporter Mla MlaB component
MALLGNYSVILKNPFTPIGGTQVSNARSAFNMEGQMLQMYYGESEGGGLPLTASLDTGTEPPYSWHLAENGGEMSSTTMTNGTATLTASQQNGINIVSTIAGVGTIDTAGLSLVTSMISAIAGSGTLTGAMVGTVQLAATLAGTGDVVGSVSMLSGLIANLAGTGAISADLKGKLFMEAQIYVNQSEATVAQIVDAVWNALLVEYNLAGSTGEALSGAGSAGNPWITDLSAYNTANTAGKILKDRLSKGQFIGLK